jgi:methylmalonyl-CoA/ethylmalonyl-CoA epimerase
MRVLDHIGIAVRSLERRLAFYRAIGLEAEAVEEVPSEKLRVAFLPIEGTSIELLEPAAPESPVAAFIAKRGEGLHHICFRVADIRAAMAELRASGFELLADEPRRGAHGALVCFIHPRSAGGVLVELSQPEG